jgi:hypothetical protein
MAIAAHAQDVMAVRQINTTRMMVMMCTWPAASNDAAMFMIGKYWSRAAMRADMVMWSTTELWKGTIVFAVEYAQEYPPHHIDVMQQWIDDRAPAARYEDPAMYDGSVVMECTSGKISARCDMFEAVLSADSVQRFKPARESQTDV